MAAALTRRRWIGALATGGWPLRGRGAGLPRVAVIGGGMAGVACAWLLDGHAEVHLFEARPALGGNVRTLPVTQGGRTFQVDLGAQYFHPGPYPTYVQLLEDLGLWPASTGESHAFTASITLSSPSQAQPRFVSPVLPGRAWPLLAPWNRSALQAFQTTFSAAQRREARDAPWALSMGDWLARLRLTPEQADTLVLPWVASLVSGDVEQARALSARALMVFAAGALPASPTDPIEYHVLDRGMAEPLRRMAAQFGSVQVATGTPVLAVAPRAGGGYVVVPQDRPALDVDVLVFAASGPPTLALLQGLPAAAAQRAALSQIGFFDATLALHADPLYAPAERRWWSFLNCSADGPWCEASMWLDPVLGTQSLWKSWVSHRPLPAQPLAVEHFRHVLPDAGTVPALQAMAQLQGAGGLWFAGGYLEPFDSQETALRSALAVAEALTGGTARTRRLRRS